MGVEGGAWGKTKRSQMGCAASAAAPELPGCQERRAVHMAGGETVWETSDSLKACSPLPLSPTSSLPPPPTHRWNGASPPPRARAGKACSLDSEVRAHQLGALGKFQEALVPQLPALQEGTSSSGCSGKALVSHASPTQVAPSRLHNAVCASAGINVATSGQRCVPGPDA